MLFLRFLCLYVPPCRIPLFTAMATTRLLSLFIVFPFHLPVGHSRVLRILPFYQINPFLSILRLLLLLPLLRPLPPQPLPTPSTPAIHSPILATLAHLSGLAPPIPPSRYSMNYMPINTRNK